MLYLWGRGCWEWLDAVPVGEGMLGVARCCTCEGGGRMAPQPDNSRLHWCGWKALLFGSVM